MRSNTTVSKWTPTPDVTVDSKIGPLRLAFSGSERDHVHVASPGGERCKITVRGREYLVYISAHLYGADAFSADRQAQITHGGGDVPPTVKAAVLAVLTEAVSTYVAARPYVLLEARQIRHANEAHRLRADLTKAREEVSRIATHLDEAEAAEAEAAKAVDLGQISDLLRPSSLD